MTSEEISVLCINSPIKLQDNRMGLLIRYPDKDNDNKCGIQVFGEEEIRWIKCEKIIDCGNGALMEVCASGEEFIGSSQYLDLLSAIASKLKPHELMTKELSQVIKNNWLVRGYWTIYQKSPMEQQDYNEFLSKSFDSLSTNQLSYFLSEFAKFDRAQEIIHTLKTAIANLQHDPDLSNKIVQAAKLSKIAEGLLTNLTLNQTPERIEITDRKAIEYYRDRARNNE
jgi:hypothetical protein